MSHPTWSFTLGDRDGLSWTWTLRPDPDEADIVGQELSQSWGSVELVADGRVLTATLQQGEQVQAAHWYLLPVVEWLVENWAAIFYESGLPQPGATAPAAIDRAFTAFDTASPVTFGDWRSPKRDADELLELAQAWRARHCLRAGAPEAPLPDVWLRRAGDELEVSTADTPSALFDRRDVRWLHMSTSCRLPLEPAQAATEQALRAVLLELGRRQPEGRAARALSALDFITAPASQDTREAWLAGLDGDVDRLDALRQQIGAIFGSEPTAGAVAMLFGSMLPTGPGDLRVLRDALHDAAPSQGLHRALDELATEHPAGDVAALPPGAAGGELGTAVYAALADDGGVDVRAWLTRHGVVITRAELSDNRLRAVTLLHDDGRAAIVLNAAYPWGSRDHVERFSLAHEFGHLLYDRINARRLALASGPWAPPPIEQRASGFAAGLLMPEPLLRARYAQLAAAPQALSELDGLAASFGVGVTALARRLENLGLLAREAVEALIDQR